MQEYEDSGDFTKKQKFIRSIKNNIIYYAILLIIAIVVLVIALIYFDFEVGGLKNFVENLIYCSYLIGLLLFYFLIGYSIINLPLKTFYKIDYERQIKYLEWRAVSLKTNLEKIKRELVDDGYLLQSTLENFNIMKRVNKSKSFEEIDNKESKDYSEERRNSSFSSSNLTDYSDFINERYNYLYNNANVFGIELRKNTVDNDKEPLNNVEELIKLNRKINKNEWDDLRIQIRLRNQYKHWLDLCTVLYETKKESKNIEITSSINNEQLVPSENSDSESEGNSIVEGSFIAGKNISKLKIFYYQKIRRPVLFIYASIIIICSLILMISQIGTFFNFSLYGKVVKAVVEKDLGIVGLHFFIMIPIIFLFIMSIYTFFKLKISGYFYMYKNRQTDSVTLMYFSTNLCRLSFSICLDFIFNIQIEFNKDKNTNKNEENNQANIFGNPTYNVMNFIAKNKNITTQIQHELNFDSEDTGLFFKIYKYAPLILIVYVLILIVKLPQRIAKLCGKRIFDSDSDESMDEIKEGHDYYMEINKKYDGGVMPAQYLVLPKSKYDN
jgi:hypothetical protein